VVPPGFGIVHQVNLEYLARGVHKTADDVYYPDTLVGTPSGFQAWHLLPLPGSGKSLRIHQ
jgi:hypothetical protein